MVKKFSSESDQSAVKRELSKNTPMVVRFHKESCPACMMSEKTWDEFARKPPAGMKVLSIEEKAIPPEVMGGISGFPTSAVLGKNGGKKHHTGAMMNVTDIEKFTQRA
jgi:thiol-disulfide isomerase/thioredoxin